MYTHKKQYLLNHSWNSPTPLLKGWGRTFQNWATWGQPKFWKKEEINLKRGVGAEMGGCYFLLLYNLILFTGCVGKVKFPLLLFGSSVFGSHLKVLIQVFTVLKHWMICIFLIHSGNVQEMLTALFKLVWNTQKHTWTIFLSTKAKFFLILKSLWWRYMKSYLKSTTLLFFSTFFR